MDRVRAIILRGGELILIKRVRPDRTYWVFPGGGVEGDETHIQALKRECKEELGIDVEVGELLFHINQEEPDFIQSSYFYSCTIVGGTLGTGNGPEFQPNNGYIGTHEIVFIPPKAMDRFDILPQEAKEAIYKKLVEDK
jgi:8-oxo-dGTP pyrophosphatase MutT (NUDIX family)